MHINKIYRFIVMLTVLLITSVSGISAQNRPSAQHTDRQKWEAEMTQYKHDRLTKELGLKDDQTTRFFALYDAMDRERRAVFSNESRTRKELKRKANPTDKDYNEATKISLAVNANVNRIETKYYQEMGKILSPKQLYQLRLAEQNLNKEFRKHARDLQKKKK